MPRHGLSPVSSHALSSKSHDARNLRDRRGKRRSRTSTRLAIESLEPRQLLSTYTIEDLGTLGGNGSLANAINAEGQVVGQAQLANGTSHAVLWNPGQPGKDLGTLGGTTSTALGINILGDIVGNADTTTAIAQPFEVPSGGSMTDLTNAPPENSLGDSADRQGRQRYRRDCRAGTFQRRSTSSFKAAYSFDPPSGTIIGLDDCFGQSEATAVGGTRAVGEPGEFPAGTVSQAFVADINTPNSSVPLPAITNQAAELRDRHLRAQRLGDAVRHGVRSRFFGKLARGAVDDSDGRQARPPSATWVMSPAPRAGHDQPPGARGQLAGRCRGG